MAQPTFPKLKNSTGLCLVDLGDNFSSRAEFLGWDVEMSQGNTQRIRFLTLERHLFFSGHLWQSVYAIRDVISRTVFQFGFYQEKWS